MKKSKLLVLGLIALMLVGGLVLVGCDLDPGAHCSGNGECTVTIDQSTSGLYVDSEKPRSSCGKSATSKYNEATGRYDDVRGCKVQENMDGKNRSFGTHSCDC
jgi:hypothetical protein